MTLAVFIVYGADHVSHIRQLVIPALAAQSYDGSITLHLVNYASGIEAFSSSDSQGKVAVVDHSAAKQPGTRFGFGEGMNFLFAQARPSPYFMLLNPDTVPDRDCVNALVQRYVVGHTGILEARQWPSEHPKEYDEATGRTPWASGACALVDSEMFAATGGFDPLYFMYCEDVDLSWRSWLFGREVVYVPEAGVMHFTGLLHYREDRYYFEHFYSARNFIVISAKYFGESGEKKALDLLATTGYTSKFTDAVKAAYADVKPYITPISVRPEHPMITITGFNMYHALRVPEQEAAHG